MQPVRNIFIGSSTEALPKAIQIAKLLQEGTEARIRLWNDIFKPGLLTFQAIEEASRHVAGAVFIASPDDTSTVRKKTVRVPRANVMIELGYMCAILGRERVALCRYDDTHLATDLAGFTYVPMGRFSRSKTMVDAEATARLLNWTRGLSGVTHGISHSQVLHGYSGSWEIRMPFQRWRTIDLSNTDDFVEFNGRLDLCIPRDGFNGHGCVHGDLTIQVRGCSAAFKVADRIAGANCEPDGTVAFGSTMHNRQQIYVHGDPPQEDGFKEEIKGPYFYNWRLSPHEQGTLVGEYVAHAGNLERSKARVSARKSTRECLL